MKRKILIAAFVLGTAGAATFVAVKTGKNAEPGTEHSLYGAEVQSVPDRLAAMPAAAAPPLSKPVKSSGKRLTANERLVTSLSEEQQERLLILLNEGSDKELSKIHGVGKTRGEAIRKARPFESVTELSKVSGVGKITFARVIEYAAKEFSKDRSLATVTATAEFKR